jgi:hypothetical protein
MEPEILEVEVSGRRFTWHNHDRWIVEGSAIRGRMFGNVGCVAYQIAARPYDKPQVSGFETFESAFVAAVEAIVQGS